MPYVYDLWKETGESTYLGILHGNKMLYLQHLDSTRDVRAAGVVGGMYDLYCSAPGKILLTYASDAFRETYFQIPKTKNTPNTLTEDFELRTELEQIRRQGYALDNEEFSRGIFCAAAPIFDYEETLQGAVGCSVCMFNHTLESLKSEILPKVIETAKKISTCLGHRP